MGAREVALGAEREEGTEAGKELPKLRCCNRTADQSGECVACIRLCFIGPCQAQQRRRSRDPRNHWRGGFRAHQNHAASAGVPLAFSQEAGDENHLALSSGYQSKPGKAPSRPLQVHTPPLAKMPIETRLGGNHTSASDSRWEAMDWARGGCGDHFWLFRAPVRGQVAELKTSSG
jgi:hypothetical protein